MKASTTRKTVTTTQGAHMRRFDSITVSRAIDSDRPVSKQDSAIQSRLADKFGLINCWRTTNPDRPLRLSFRGLVNSR